MELNKNTLQLEGDKPYFEPLEHDIGESIIQGRPVKKKPKIDYSRHDQSQKKLNIQSNG